MTDQLPTCFIAMPITTHEGEAARYGDDSEHWLHVMETLFIPAITAAGYKPIVPAAKGAFLIHASIIKHLSEADLVLCDLSSHNPNVFFELGVRTSINLPIALVKDEHTKIPFDTSGINTHQYKSSLHGWDKDSETAALKQHITDSAESCDGKNPLWSQFGLSIRAEEPTANESPTDAKIDLLLNEVSSLRTMQQDTQRRLATREAVQEFSLDEDRRRHPSNVARNRRREFEISLREFANDQHFKVPEIQFGQGHDVTVMSTEIFEDGRGEHIRELAARFGFKADIAPF